MLDVLETFLYGSRDQKTHQPPAYEASAALAAGRTPAALLCFEWSAAHWRDRRARRSRHGRNASQPCSTRRRLLVRPAARGRKRRGAALPLSINRQPSAADQ